MYLRMVCVLFRWVIVSAAVLLAGCLLVVPAPEIEDIGDQRVAVGEELVLELSADGGGRDISFSYEIDEEGWVSMDGDVFRYTFDQVGEYRVRITASNGLREDAAEFSVQVVAEE